MNKVVRSVTEFVSEDLSNWYIRRNRRRFWSSNMDNDKFAVYQTTYEVLEGLCRIIAPITPFVSDEIWTSLTNQESVHLAYFPEYNAKYVSSKIEERMDLIRDLISLGRNVREDAKIKVRQPLSMAILDAKKQPIISDLVDLIKEELNIKEVVFENNLENYMNYEVKPNFKVCGPLFGANIKLLSQELQKLSIDEIDKLNNNEKVMIKLNEQDYELDSSMVDIRINAKEGFNVGSDSKNFIILNTTLTDELINEGIVREMISKVQNERKQRDFNIVDRIKIYYYSEQNLEEKLHDYLEFIKNETLAVDIINQDNNGVMYNLNGYDTKIDVERI